LVEPGLTGEEAMMAPSDWKILRGGRRWTREESNRRLYQAPEKIEFVGGIFSSDRERRTVLGMLLENLGIDVAVEYGRLEDWKAAIVDRELREQAGGKN
jgi:hypothetical protein